MNRLDLINGMIEMMEKPLAEGRIFQFTPATLDEIKWMAQRIERLTKVLKSGRGAMTYAYEDHSDQYYLNVKNQFEEALLEEDS